MHAANVIHDENPPLACERCHDDARRFGRVIGPIVRNGEQSGKRKTQLQLTVNVDEPFEDRVRTVRNPMHRAMIRYFDNLLALERVKFRADFENDSTEPRLVLRGDRLRQEARSLFEVLFVDRAIQQELCRFRKDRTIVAVLDLSELWAGPIASHADAIPTGVDDR
jgi:hypothetical protein